MEAVVGGCFLVVLVIIVRAIVHSNGSLKGGPVTAPPPTRVTQPPKGAAASPPRVARARVAPQRTRLAEPDIIGGWILGHAIAHGHTGFPGDPLPGGHLGSPADLAFWGSVSGWDEDPDA